MIWRLYTFSKEQPQYFALVFLDRNVPRISKEYERFAFMSMMRDKTTERMQRCIDTGALPAEVNIHAAIRLLFAPVLGFAAMRLSNRLAPGEDPDLLVRQSIDVTLVGLRHHPPVGTYRTDGPFHPSCDPGR
ncbi:MAG: TetR-like C-terminal domain-containing protein [Vicinamibacterales bacterium]